jgi:hypothetical protein
VEYVINSLQTTDPKWLVEIGIPSDPPEWIQGVDFARADEGPFNALLCRIGERLYTHDRKTIAASFALRFGWTASAAIAPYIILKSVPDVNLANISLRFQENTLFERTAIHVPSGTVLGNWNEFSDPLVQVVKNQAELLAQLRSRLREQAMPVVDALHERSRFSQKATLAMITSSWASQFVKRV